MAIINGGQVFEKTCALPQPKAFRFLPETSILL